MMKIDFNDVLAAIFVCAFAFCFICCGIAMLSKVI